MKKLDEIQKYLSEKRDIYVKIIDAIEDAIEKDKTKILLKKIRIMDTVVDAFAPKEEWSGCLHKALKFFENSEDYESCQRCINLLGKISEK
jgi:hypothetical protein